jgi:DNA-binding NarL/FixJ family response regulator
MGGLRLYLAKSILIVDDSPAVRRTLRRTLEAVGLWEVCGEAVDGRDAIEKARQFNPDLVVLDLSMPVMNGLQVSRELRRLLPRVPLVMFTSFESAHLRGEAIEAGVSSIISKSEPVQNLLNSIQSLLEEPAS